jgi:hypothetical protein
LRKNGELAASYKNPQKYLEQLIDRHVQKLARCGVDSEVASRDVAVLRSSLYGYAGVTFAKIGGGDAA